MGFRRVAGIPAMCSARNQRCTRKMRSQSLLPRPGLCRKLGSPVTWRKKLNINAITQESIFHIQSISGFTPSIIDIIRFPVRLNAYEYGEVGLSIWGWSPIHYQFYVAMISGDSRIPMAMLCTTTQIQRFWRWAVLFSERGERPADGWGHCGRVT